MTENKRKGNVTVDPKPNIIVGPNSFYRKFVTTAVQNHYLKHQLPGLVCLEKPNLNKPCYEPGHISASLDGFKSGNQLPCKVKTAFTEIDYGSRSLQV